MFGRNCLKNFAVLIFFILRISHAASLSLPETMTTASGHLFQKTHSLSALGDAWKDDSGIVWGDLVQDSKGQPALVTQAQANDYCQQIGARLASRMEFIQLALFLGDGCQTGFDPLSFPNLEGHLFWSSTFSSAFAHQAYVFHGSTGALDFVNSQQRASFRCVINANDQSFP
jgi:hypothetical protein